MNDQTIDIHENRQVRMSLRLLYAIFGTVLTSMFIVMGTYFKFDNKNAMQDLQFQVLKLQVDKLEVEVERLKTDKFQRRDN
ncbi:hypothetical protein D3C80_1257160 [compost metagenome]